jgi:hypothetical protein
MPREAVWIFEQGRWGWLVNRGAFFSVVTWTEDGLDYEDIISNDEYEFWEDRVTDYESE